ncbi:MAG: hypothetical protein KF886_10170 [Candidatus Hydrogenedentes bacterium]|nr:hypothetical protein [Candidatus Hydrogenedentota bacterium]
MKVVSIAEIHRRSVESLRLDADALDLTSVEVVAATIRRAASFYCPCPMRTLGSVVVGAHRGIIDDSEAFARTVDDTIESLVAYGDLLELEEPDLDDAAVRGRTLLYCAPPCCVPRLTGSLLLLGISADGVSSLPNDLEASIEYSGHSRILQTTNGDDLERLKELGFLELSMDAWLRSPAKGSPEQFLVSINEQLRTVSAAGEIAALRIINPDSNVDFYRGRWVEPTNECGKFVGRRPQLYGADIWCYVELKDGQPLQLIDLPLARSKWRGCDDAWLIQLALDAVRGNPQKYLVRRGPPGTTIVDFFSPLPMWAKRRLDAMGETVPPMRSLFSYKFRDDELAEEADFLQKRLWLAPAC